MNPELLKYLGSHSCSLFPVGTSQGLRAGGGSRDGEVQGYLSISILLCGTSTFLLPGGCRQAANQSLWGSPAPRGSQLSQELCQRLSVCCTGSGGERRSHQSRLPETG